MAANSLKSIVRNALEKDAQPAPSADHSLSTTSAEQDGDEYTEAQSDFTGLPGDRGDSMPHLAISDKATENTDPVNSNQDAMDRELEMATQYYEKPVRTFEARMTPFYEPVYYGGACGVQRGYASTYTDVVEYELVYDRKSKNDPTEYAVCVTCVFLFLLVFCTVGLMVALIWAKEGEVIVEYSYMSHPWP